MDAEAAARAAAEAEAALPSEEKTKLENAKLAEAKKAEGNTYYKAKNFPKAIELYSAAIELNSSEIIYYSNLAAVYIE